MAMPAFFAFLACKIISYILTSLFFKRYLSSFSIRLSNLVISSFCFVIRSFCWLNILSVSAFSSLMAPTPKRIFVGKLKDVIIGVEDLLRGGGIKGSRG